MMAPVFNKHGWYWGAGYCASQRARDRIGIMADRLLNRVRYQEKEPWGFANTLYWRKNLF
jgi:hypothetical protein